MQTPYRQRGATLLSWSVTAMVVIFFIICAVKIGPLYISNWTLDSVISRPLKNGEFAGKTPAEIRIVLGKLFDTNRVDVISIRDVKIQRIKGEMSIDASYESRVELIGNIDVVVKFTNQYAVAGRSASE